jgi:phosphatidylglycerol---prolipoprotein diacylglyceryl transferase
MPIHLIFDILAASASFAMTLTVYQWRLKPAGDRIATAGLSYAMALVGGAVLGAYAIGTLNLILSGQTGIGRSIVGALAGAIVAIEAYKRVTGLRGSTGVIFVPAFATSIAVGRIGCFLSGLDDFTYGTPTSLSFGVDFGDGIPRHPVQLYESASMALFLIAALAALKRRSAFFLSSGFYLLTGWYAAQRFLWEFLKPYPAVVGPLNVFHLVCLGLLAYSAAMILRGQNERTRS